MEMKQKYKGWDLLDMLPDGWKIDKTAGSPLHGYEFCTNGKSILNGQKRALVRVKSNCWEKPDSLIIKEVVAKTETTESKYENYTFPAKNVNELARKKFQEQLLKEIMFDLMVCDIEGWCKVGYIKELRGLLNRINVYQSN